MILTYLKERLPRYGGLRALIPKLSDKVLRERLLDLEELGLAKRTHGPDDERRMVYELTKRRKALSPTLEALYSWGGNTAPSVGLRVRIPEST